MNIIVAPAGRGLYRTSLDGRHLITARQPFFSAARILQAEGFDSETPISMQWEGSDIVAMRSTIGRAAGLSVTEDDNGIRLTKYRPGPAARWAASPAAEALEPARALAG